MKGKTSRRALLSDRLKTITELLEALLLMDGEVRLGRPEAEGLLLALEDVAGQIVGLEAPQKTFAEAQRPARYGAPNLVSRRFKAVDNVIFPRAFHRASSAGEARR